MPPVDMVDESLVYVGNLPFKLDREDLEAELDGAVGRYTLPVTMGSQPSTLVEPLQSCQHSVRGLTLSPSCAILAFDSKLLQFRPQTERGRSPHDRRRQRS